MPGKTAKTDPKWLRIGPSDAFLQLPNVFTRTPRNQQFETAIPAQSSPRHILCLDFEQRRPRMTNQDRQRPGGKSDRRKQKRNKKAEQQQSPAPDQAQTASEPIEIEVAPEEAVESVAAVEAAPAEPVERVASFAERMASVMPPVDIAPAKPAAPVDIVQASPSDAVAPATGIQAITNAYRDYTRKSLEDAQSFAEKLTAARSLDKAVEAQTEFARQACDTFADNSRKIRTLYRELFWQSLQFPKWPPGQAQR
jgi:phasin family protein